MPARAVRAHRQRFTRSNLESEVAEPLSPAGYSKEPTMKRSAFGAVLATAVFGLLLASPAAAKTAKECRAEWSAHKAEYKAKGVTEKAYVATCRAEAKNEKAAEKKQKKETKKEKAAEKKAAKTKAERATENKKASATAGKKTVKECQAEWRADKAAFKSKGITEKAYVARCRAGTAMTPAVAPASEPKKTVTSPTRERKMTSPAPAPKMTSPAPATGKPSGANQYASESAAKAHCRSGTVVWANLNSKIYHFAGHHDYGHTKNGAYMCEKDATAQGMRAAKNEKHP
jgi:hypothetical protein